MQNQPQQGFENLDQAARAQTIVAGTLVGAVIVLATAATFFRPEEPQIGPLTFVLGVMFLAEAVAFLIVPNIKTRQAINDLNIENETDDSLRLSLAGVFLQRMILRMALCEGAAFFAIIVWMKEGNLIVLGILTTIVVTQMTIFPTRHTLENWIDKQLDEIRAGNRLG